MRQALFAIVLVAASFAGGAVVNGPGLRWAESVVMTRLGLKPFDDAEAEAGPDVETAPPPTGGIPIAPIPPLAAGPYKDKDKPGGPSRPQGPARSPKGSPQDSSSRASSGDPAKAASPSAPEPTERAATGVPSVERLEPLVTSHEREHERERGHAPAPAPRPAADGALSRASLAGKGGGGGGDAGAGLATDPADWAGVRRALRALGVSRYGTDGEPGGRARFHCVIPLAGRRAVGQHFEAEGDDEFQAARAALRRIALWRATEAAGPAP